MARQKPLSRTVTPNGNSLSVTLPPDWLEANDIECGDEISMSVDSDEIRFGVDGD